jgi:hypothetical protein
MATAKTNGRLLTNSPSREQCFLFGGLGVWAAVVNWWVEFGWTGFVGESILLIKNFYSEIIKPNFLGVNKNIFLALKHKNYLGTFVDFRTLIFLSTSCMILSTFLASAFRSAP